MKIFGLIGFPLGHSFSQKYFTAKFERESISDCRFELFPIPSIVEFPSLLQQYPGLRGLSVTIPYKKSVIPYLHNNCLPEGVNACNSIKIENGRLTGYNTDAIGFEKSFSTMLLPHHTAALILGNGGATEAVAFVLKKLGLDFRIVSRRIHDNSSFTYEDLTADVMSRFPVIINATPLGTFPNVESCPPIPYKLIGPQHYLFDLVYNPERTLFLQEGADRGALIKNGYDMLALQAEASWELWNS